MKCVICDIDGVIADTRHRLPLLRGEKPDWDGFFEGSKHDTPREHVVFLLKLIRGQARILLFTSRPAQFMRMTVDWLHEHNVPFDQVLMRCRADQRPDTEVKASMLDYALSEGLEPIFAIEDRPEIVAMYRARGVPCLAEDPVGWSDQHHKFYEA